MKKFTLRGMAFFVISLMIVAQSFAQTAKKQTKVSNDLLSVAQAKNTQPQLKSAVSTTLKKLDQVQIRHGNYVVVDVIAVNSTSELAQDLEKIGMINISAYGGVVSGLLPISSIDLLENISTLKYAVPAYKPNKNSGKAVTNGDYAMKSNIVRANLGIDGSGVRIGVLSDSYDNLGTADQGVASGEIPGPGNPDGYDKPVNVLEDLPEEGTDEGRGMIEIVHDVAPGAELAFHTAFNGRASFAQGIIDLAKSGCQVITDDVSYFNEPFFQDGIITQAADQAVKEYKVSYFSSAGNSDRDSYQSKFRPGGIYTVTSIFGDTIGNYMLHDFDAGPGLDVFQQVTFAPYGTMAYALQWDDPFASTCEGCPGAKTDLDIFLALEKDPSTIVLESIYSNIDGDPFEYLSAANSGTDSVKAFIAIGKWIDASAPSPNPGLIKFINFGDNSIDEYYTPSPTCFGHHNSEQAVSVGAAPWYRTPVFGTNPPKVEYFSSVGGIPILFNTKGKRLSRPEVRQNPLFVAPDGGNTSFFGFQLNDGDTFPNFFGTSASAPHAAAVAALLKQAAGGQVSEKEIVKIMAGSTIDMDDPATTTFDKNYDYKTGYGLLQANMAVDKLLKRVGIKAIIPYAECSPKPDSVRIWRLYNPNPFSVNVKWEIANNMQADSIMAKPGDNYITTMPQPCYNLLIIAWNGAYGETRKAAAFSRGERCNAPKSAIAGNIISEPLMINSVYPSPFVNNFTLEIYNGTEKSILVSLFDMQGRLAYSTRVETSENYSIVTLNADNLSNGMYFMKVTTQDGKFIGSYKLIKK
jgi:hypothetical protein